MYDISKLISKDQLQKILNTSDHIDEWYELCIEFFAKYNINTKERIAAFLSQTGHESNSFRVISENLNYSADRLRKVFKKYFTSAIMAKRYANQPEKIASRVYANRLGNGNEASRDGWIYRGRGLIQLTGKYNYELFAKSIGLAFNKVVEYLSTRRGAFESACWFWYIKGLNYFADKQDTLGLTKAINGGTNGLEDREVRYRRALDILSQTDNSNDLIKKVQIVLGVKADGVFGPKTKLALAQWQAKNGLVADGILGPITLKAMLGI